MYENSENVTIMKELNLMYDSFLFLTLIRIKSNEFTSSVLVTGARKICSAADSLGLITPVPLNYVLSVDCLRAGEISALV